MRYTIFAAVAFFSFLLGGLTVYTVLPFADTNKVTDELWQVRVSPTETRDMPPGDVIAILNQNTQDYLTALEASLAEKIQNACK